MMSLLLSKVARMILLLFIIINMSFHLGNAEGVHYVDHFDEVLKMMRKAAVDICSDIPVSGKSSNFELSGKSKLEVSKLVRKVADLGFTGAIKYQESRWEGLLQKDLAASIRTNTHCKLTIWNDLKRFLIPETFGFPEPDNVSPSNPVASTLDKNCIPEQTAKAVLETIWGDNNKPLLITSSNKKQYQKVFIDHFENWTVCNGWFGKIASIPLKGDNGVFVINIFENSTNSLFQAHISNARGLRRHDVVKVKGVLVGSKKEPWDILVINSSNITKISSQDMDQRESRQ